MDAAEAARQEQIRRLAQELAEKNRLAAEIAARLAKK